MDKEDSIRRLINKVGYRKSVKIFIKIYKNLCSVCKSRAKISPRMPADSYCGPCQIMAEKELQEVLKYE